MLPPSNCETKVAGNPRLGNRTLSRHCLAVIGIMMLIVLATPVPKAIAGEGDLCRQMEANGNRQGPNARQEQSAERGKVSEALAARHADAYITEWQATRPDLVVFIPDSELGPETENQEFIVIPLKSGDFFAVWTSGHHESHPNQHIVFSKSSDRGLTWSRPATIAGPTSREMTEAERQKKRDFLEWVPERTRNYLNKNRLGIADRVLPRAARQLYFSIFVARRG